MNYPVRKDDHHRFLEDAMQYALLIYAAPSSREDESRCDGGVFGSWIDCTQALKSAGALLEAEQLLPPGAGPGGAGGADPAVPRRTQDAGDRKRVPGARADHGQAAGGAASDAHGTGPGGGH